MKRSGSAKGNTSKRAKSDFQSKSTTRVVGYSDNGSQTASSSGASSNSDYLTVEVTSYRSSNTGWLIGNTVEREVDYALPEPPEPPLEEGSAAFDEYGSLHSGLDDIQENLPDTPPSSTDTSDTSSSTNPREATTNENNQSTSSTSKPHKVAKPDRMQAALLRWLPLRNSTLEELIRHDGLGNRKLDCCNICQGGEAVFKCDDCFASGMHCEECLLSTHERLPCHRISKYNGSYFQKQSLRDLGQRLQLGHEDGSTCHSPLRGPEHFTLVDVTGIHEVSINFCNCGYTSGGSLKYNQLLRAGWFPATVDIPSTAITFHCLDTFVELNQQSKMNTYDYYIGLSRITDNTGRLAKQSRYHEFSLAVRLWRHLLMLKRSGRAHDPGGVAATKQGELAVECPACPHPSRNLPEGWEKLPNQRLYTQYLAMDANFRHKLKDRGLNDIELAPGWAYFVEEESFQTFIRTHEGESESNSCRSQFNALLHATTTKAAGYKATGIGAVVCGRHSLMRPNGVCDLQLGERYVNMDYIFLCTLTGTGARYVLVSYDIACQWSKNLLKRQAAFPCAMRLSSSVVLIFAIPKFHLPGHGPKCQTRYSLNFLPNVGRTYGEGVESEWAHINALSTSAREMAEGMRHESLNDHWGAWNWCKIILFGFLFKKNLIEALTEFRRHKGIFEEFSETFDKAILANWEAMILAWEENQDLPDPYLEEYDTKSANDVRTELAQEEADELAKSNTVSPHAMTASVFLSEGLELEERQRKLLLRDTTRDNQLNKKTASLQERRNKLWVDVGKWRKHQDGHMPVAASLRVKPDDRPATTAEEEGAVKHPETLRLCLPSSLPPELIDERMAIYRSKEARLRRAQADDALAKICRLRRTITAVYIFKRLNVSGTGQKPNTRVREVFDSLSHLCERAAAKYRAARAALVALDPNGSWQERLKVLRNSDISGPQRDTEIDRSEGRYEMSWIWRTPGSVTEVSKDSQEFSEDMRIEWSKARARQLRWGEEIQLIVEEMRRVVAFLEWKSAWWLSRRSLKPNSTQDIRDGLRAYAEKQAAIMHDIAYRCVVLWAPLLAAAKIPTPWLTEYTAKYPLPSSTAYDSSDVDYDISSLFK